MLIISHLKEVIVIESIETFDSDNKRSEESESDIENVSQYPPFGNMSPWYVEFTNIVPEYPKTHLKGYATFISLNDSVLNPTAIDELRKGFQYSLYSGCSKWFINDVEFFGIKEELEVSMEHSMRQCAGVKVCEFLSEDSSVENYQLYAPKCAKISAAQQLAHAWGFASRAPGFPFPKRVQEQCTAQWAAMLPFVANPRL